MRKCNKINPNINIYPTVSKKENTMSWTCPHQTKDAFCTLRKKACKPSSEGCILAKKFTFLEDEPNSEMDKNTRTRKKNTRRKK